MARPKVFSLFKNKQYSDLFPQIELLNTPFNIFLQCASYDIIIPTADADSLKNAIIELADVSARTQMGKWNGAKVRNEYMIDMVAKRIIRIYREVTA